MLPLGIMRRILRTLMNKSIDYIALLDPRSRTPEHAALMEECAKKLRELSKKMNIKVVIPSNYDEYLEYRKRDLEHQAIFINQTIGNYMTINKDKT